MAELNTIIAAANEMDLDTLKATIAALRDVKKAKAEEGKAISKAEKEAAKAELAEKGKAYWATLSIGDPVAYKKVDGTILEGTVGEVKEGAKSAHVILNEVPAGAKSDKRDRYPAYSALVM